MTLEFILIYGVVHRQKVHALNFFLRIVGNLTNTHNRK